MRRSSSLSLVFAVTAAACATSAPAPGLPTTASAVARSAPEASDNDLEEYLEGARARSCGQVQQAEDGFPVALSVRPITLDRLGLGQQRVGALRYVGGFHLSSDDAAFGGLSGVDVREDGGLLAVSDDGQWVWIDLAKDGVTPVGARKGPLLDASGEAFPNKAARDAEGLTLAGDVALVSFEQDHRILAYGVGACGIAARGVETVRFTDAFRQAGIEVDGNSGLEALAATSDWIVLAGLETQRDDAGPVFASRIDAEPVLSHALGQGAPQLVGLDLVEDPDGRTVRAYSLHRGFAPATGASISVVETVFERADGGALRRTSERRLADMGALLLNVDNFEAIAARPSGDGRVRLYIISDDNFSDRQRTLMMVFESGATG
jgi:hypothetical protein